MKIQPITRLTKRMRYPAAVLLAAVVVAAWMAVSKADTGAPSNETTKPGSDAAAKPLDKSCYVRQEDGLVRYYLEGPPRDGELPYLQGQPITGADGKIVLRNEVPKSDIPPRILRAQPCPPGKHHL